MFVLIFKRKLNVIDLTDTSLSSGYIASSADNGFLVTLTGEIT